MKESFGVENPQDGTVENRWPSEELLPGFRDFMERFFQVKISLLLPPSTLTPRFK